LAQEHYFALLSLTLEPRQLVPPLQYGGVLPGYPVGRAPTATKQWATGAHGLGLVGPVSHSTEHTDNRGRLATRGLNIVLREGAPFAAHGSTDHLRAPAVTQGGCSAQQ